MTTLAEFRNFVLSPYTTLQRQIRKHLVRC
uniref:Uncharacterized protein n=1 Tax=Arundo donax TaxID=35708 RepID=A0A0A9B1I6_ARUDO